jgi:geranylgeranyl pyrophosphate synthase
MRTAPIEHRILLRSLLEGNDPDKGEQIRNLILPSGSIHFAQERARELVDRGRSAIGILPPTEARTALEAMADFVVNRPM